MKNKFHTKLCSALKYEPETGLFTWLISGGRAQTGRVAGWKNSSGYVCINFGGRAYRAHRLAWFIVHKTWPAQLDHINGVRSDNRIINLRVATYQQNIANSKVRKSNRSGLKGVSFARHANRWMARITANGKEMYLGYFDSKELAHKAYMRAAVKHFGEFAHSGAR